MPIKIEITADDPTELQGWARLLLGMDPGEIGEAVTLTPSGAAATATAVTNPHGFGTSEDGSRRGGNRRGRPPKAETAAAAPEPAGEPAGEPEKPKEGEVIPPDAKVYTPDDLRNEMKRISADHGIEATRKLLARMGVAKLGDVETAKYAEFMSVAKTWTGADA